MTITKIEDHVTDGLKLFNTFFSDKVKFRAWAATYLVQVQELENALWETLAQQGLEEVVPGQGFAMGVFLDAIGKLVGESRDGKTDEQYLPYIRAKVKANNSDGQVETLYDVLRLILPESLHSTFSVVNHGWDEVEIVLGELDSDQYAAVYRFMLLAVSAAVRLLINYSPAGPSNSFTFSDQPYDPMVDRVSAQRGFGSVSVGIGGGLTHTVEAI